MGLRWAGLNCSGDATIILEGKNTVIGFYDWYPGIHVPEGKTLTIKGNGELEARSNGAGAGIGGGFGISCGNIIIDGGTIKAEGGRLAAGIGVGDLASCGNITITKNVIKVTATHGERAPNSIGAGAGVTSTCGTVTIGDKVTGSISESPYTFAMVIDLSTITVNYTVQDGKILTGKLSANVKVSIEDGATVTGT